MDSAIRLDVKVAKLKIKNISCVVSGFVTQESRYGVSAKQRHEDNDGYRAETMYRKEGRTI